MIKYSLVATKGRTSNVLFDWQQRSVRLRSVVFVLDLLPES